METIESYQNQKKRIDELENQIQDLESVSIRLAITDRDSDAYVDAQNQLCAIIDDLVNTYPLESDQLFKHSELVASKFNSNPEQQALKRIETIHQAFMSEICDYYSPIYWVSCRVL